MYRQASEPIPERGPPFGFQLFELYIVLKGELKSTPSPPTLVASYKKNSEIIHLSINNL